LNLTGSGTLGERRTLASAALPDARLLAEEARYAALLSLDLPLERTAERNVLRNSYIALEQAVRDYQEQEDRVKLDVRDRLRELLEAREGVRTQTMAVAVARRRVASTELFLRAGRAQIRDLLEAQEDLLTASNALSAARVNYRVAELALQRDMGVLHVDEEGLWTEYLEATADDEGT
jgi:outer membrane protein TolC